LPACRYRVAPGVNRFNDNQHTSFVDLIGEPGGCAWTASSSAPWLTFSSEYAAGSNGVSVPYTVAQNVSGGDRTGRIVFAWPGGTATHFVDQSGSNFITSFTMTDSFRSGAAPTTECHLRSSATPCTFNATSNLPGPGAYTFAWTATYVYSGVEKTVTQTNTTGTFTFTDACGATDASAGGTDANLDVTVTVTDSVGNSQTVRSGNGNQPALLVKKFSC
jgi:hypothetical protein